MRRSFRIIITMLLILVCFAGCTRKSPLESGMTALQNGEYEEAEKNFKEAIERDILPGDAYRGIGIIRWEEEDYEKARDAFQLALENDAEKTATLYNFLGTCELRLGNAKAAVNDYNLGIGCEDASDEMLQEMKYNMIVAYEQLGEWDTVRVKTKEYAEAYPDDERMAKEAEFFETQ